MSVPWDRCGVTPEDLFNWESVATSGDAFVHTAVDKSDEHLLLLYVQNNRPELLQNGQMYLETIVEENSDDLKSVSEEESLGWGSWDDDSASEDDRITVVEVGSKVDEVGVQSVRTDEDLLVPPAGQGSKVEEWIDRWIDSVCHEILESCADKEAQSKMADRFMDTPVSIVSTVKDVLNFAEVTNEFCLFGSPLSGPTRTDFWHNSLDSKCHLKSDDLCGDDKQQLNSLQNEKATFNATDDVQTIFKDVSSSNCERFVRNDLLEGFTLDSSLDETSTSFSVSFDEYEQKHKYETPTYKDSFEDKFKPIESKIKSDNSNVDDSLSERDKINIKSDLSIDSIKFGIHEYSNHPDFGTRKFGYEDKSGNERTEISDVFNFSDLINESKVEIWREERINSDAFEQSRSCQFIDSFIPVICKVSQSETRTDSALILSESSQIQCTSKDFFNRSTQDDFKTFHIDSFDNRFEEKDKQDLMVSNKSLLEDMISSKELKESESQFDQPVSIFNDFLQETNDDTFSSEKSHLSKDKDVLFSFELSKNDQDDESESSNLLYSENKNLDIFPNSNNLEENKETVSIFNDTSKILENDIKTFQDSNLFEFEKIFSETDISNCKTIDNAFVVSENLINWNEETTNENTEESILYTVNSEYAFFNAEIANVNIESAHENTEDENSYLKNDDEKSSININLENKEITPSESLFESNEKNLISENINNFDLNRELHILSAENERFEKELTKMPDLIRCGTDLLQDPEEREPELNWKSQHPEEFHFSNNAESPVDESDKNEDDLVTRSVTRISGLPAEVHDTLDDSGYVEESSGSEDGNPPLQLLCGLVAPSAKENLNFSDEKHLLGGVPLKSYAHGQTPITNAESSIVSESPSSIYSFDTHSWLGKPHDTSQSVNSAATFNDRVARSTPDITLTVSTSEDRSRFSQALAGVLTYTRARSTPDLTKISPPLAALFGKSVSERIQDYLNKTQQTKSEQDSRRYRRQCVSAASVIEKAARFEARGHNGLQKVGMQDSKPTAAIRPTVFRVTSKPPLPSTGRLKLTNARREFFENLSVKQQIHNEKRFETFREETKRDRVRLASSTPDLADFITAPVRKFVDRCESCDAATQPKTNASPYRRCTGDIVWSSYTDYLHRQKRNRIPETNTYLETDLDTLVCRKVCETSLDSNSKHKAISMLALDSPSPQPPAIEDGTRARSMDFLLEDDNRAAVLAPENTLSNRVKSERELRIERSLQNLTIPDWYKQSEWSRKPKEGFLLKRESDKQGWKSSGSRTPSVSSLTTSTPRKFSTDWRNVVSLRSSRESLPTGSSCSLSPREQGTFHYGLSRWSSSRLSTGSVPSTTASSQPSWNAYRSFRQPYLGWRAAATAAQSPGSGSLSPAPHSPLYARYSPTSPRLDSADGGDRRHDSYPANGTFFGNVSEIAGQHDIHERPLAFCRDRYSYIQSVYNSELSWDANQHEAQEIQQQTPDTSPQRSKMVWMESSFVGQKSGSQHEPPPKHNLRPKEPLGEYVIRDFRRYGITL